jgi:hypothetical protein
MPNITFETLRAMDEAEVLVLDVAWTTAKGVASVQVGDED